MSGRDIKVGEENHTCAKNTQLHLFSSKHNPLSIVDCEGYHHCYVTGMVRISSLLIKGK
jgi:hypothetical protein